MNILPAKAAKAFKRIARKTAARRAADASMAKLVVALAFLLVLQNLVRFINLFEFGLITALFIWMVFHRQFAKSFLYRILRSGLWHA